MLNHPVKPVKKKATKPLKGHPRSPWTGWLLSGTVAMLLVMALAWAAVKTTVYAAERTASSLGKAAEAVVISFNGFAQIALESTCQVLNEGEEEQRLQILNELAKIDCTGLEAVPEKLLDAITKNLEHENPEIRNAARRVMGKLKPVIDDSLVKTVVLK